jgi:Fe-S-cluster containining protein
MIPPEEPSGTPGSPRPPGRTAPPHHPARIFLRFDQTLAAIARDFAQYAPQTGLFCGLVPLVFGSQALVSRKPGRDEVWLRIETRGVPERLDGRRLGERLAARLRADPPDPRRLAAICRRVFQGRTVVGEKDGHAGFWVETGMEGYTCRRCGHCCRDLCFEDGGTAADWEGFAALGRRDILAWIDPIRRDGRVVACRLWIDPATGRPAAVCPWLVEEARGHFACRIHPIRPEICRQYPATRKHAEMTGCIGFRSR